MSRAAIYLRVSTGEQSVASQRAEVEAAAAARGFAEVEVFEEVASGAKVSREALDRMMAGVRKRRFGAVLAYKLDRLGRSVSHLAQLFGELETAGCALIVPGQGIDTSESNPAGKLQMHVLAAVAEFERSIISDRTKAGLAAARKRGRVGGRRKGSSNLPDSRKRKAWALLDDHGGKVKLSMLMKECGIAQGTASAWRKEWGKGDCRS